MVIFVLGNGLMPIQYQAIDWTNTYLSTTEKKIEDLQETLFEYKLIFEFWNNRFHACQTRFRETWFANKHQK